MNICPFTKAPRLPNNGLIAMRGSPGTASRNRVLSSSVGLGICIVVYFASRGWYGVEPFAPVNAGNRKAPAIRPAPPIERLPHGPDHASRISPHDAVKRSWLTPENRNAGPVSHQAMRARARRPTRRTRWRVHRRPTWCAGRLDSLPPARGRMRTEHPCATQRGRRSSTRSRRQRRRSRRRCPITKTRLPTTAEMVPGRHRRARPSSPHHRPSPAARRASQLPPPRSARASHHRASIPGTLRSIAPESIPAGRR